MPATLTAPQVRTAPRAAPPRVGEPVSIVIPTYREAENVAVLAHRLFAALHDSGVSAELIIVDDDSRDGTDLVVSELARQFPVRLITRRGERDLSTAVLRGFAAARHDLLVCMDADLSHPPHAVAAVIAPVAEGEAELSIGSRYVEGGRIAEQWGLLRRANSWVATLLARPLTDVRDPLAGFFCLRKSTLRQAALNRLRPIGYKIGLELLLRGGCRMVREVPIEFSERLHGKSKLTIKQQARYLIHLWRLYRFSRPVMSWTLAGLCGIALLTTAAALL